VKLTQNNKYFCSRNGYLRKTVFAYDGLSSISMKGTKVPCKIVHSDIHVKYPLELNSLT